MEKSPTINKPEIEQAVKQAVKKIRRWTKQELGFLLQQIRPSKQPPIIIPLSDRGYLIGNYAIMIVDNRWHMIYRYSDQELVFETRAAAIMFAVCNQTSRYQLAKQIQHYDENINRLNVKADEYRNRIKQKTNKSHNAKDLYVSRYHETKAQINYNRFLLEKTLKLAKYYNF